MDTSIKLNSKQNEFFEQTGIVPWGRWAVIDLETTGMDPGSDEIIDIGYYLFEGNHLIKSFHSLCKTRHVLSPFIKQLTGITDEMLVDAPSWDKICSEVNSDLNGATLIAHNASFEQSYLSSKLENVTFLDSLTVLPFLHVDASSLSLEVLLKDLNLAPFEMHRALADARDLLRVLLNEAGEIKGRKKLWFELMEKYSPQHEELRLWKSWWSLFFMEDGSGLNQEGKLLFDRLEDDASLDENKPDVQVHAQEQAVLKEALTTNWPTEPLKKEHIQTLFSDKIEYKWMATKILQSLRNGISGGIYWPPHSNIISEVVLPILERESGKTLLFDLTGKCVKENSKIPLQFQAFCQSKSNEFKNTISEMNWVNLFVIFAEEWSRRSKDYFSAELIPGFLFRKFDTMAEALSHVTLAQQSCQKNDCSFFSNCSYIANREKKLNQQIIPAHLSQWKEIGAEVEGIKQIVILGIEQIEDSVTKDLTTKEKIDESDERYADLARKLSQDSKFNPQYGIEKLKSIEQNKDNQFSELHYYELKPSSQQHESTAELYELRTPIDISGWMSAHFKDDIPVLFLSSGWNKAIDPCNYLSWASGLSKMKPAKRYATAQRPDGLSLFPSPVELLDVSLTGHEPLTWLQGLAEDFVGSIYFASEYQKNRELLKILVAQLISNNPFWKGRFHFLNYKDTERIENDKSSILVVGKLPDFSFRLPFQQRREWIQSQRIFQDEYNNYWLMVRALKLLTLTLCFEKPLKRVYVLDERVGKWSTRSWEGWEKILQGF